MTEHALCGALILAMLTSAASSARGERSDAPATSWERYSVIVARNIFLKDRAQRESRRSTRPTTPAYRPERNLLLTGAARQGERCVAFIEDIRTGAVTRVAANDMVLGGRITEITLDHLVYEKDDRKITVPIGKNFGGDANEAAGAYEAAESESAPPSLPGDAAGVIERLRQQRLKELQKP